MDKRVKICVPASTSNLGPCFDTIGLALELYNTFTFMLDASLNGPTVTIEGHGAEEIETGIDNLSYRGFALVFQSFGVAVPEVHIHQHNEIPIARGFGGSSTAVLAGVMAAYEFLGKEAAKDDILTQSLAIDGFADNLTPSLLGGLVVSTIEEGHVTYIKVPIPPQLAAVVYIPDVTMPTGKSRQVLPRQIPFEDAVFNLRASALLIAALTTGSMNKLSIAMRDRLHQPYRASLLPMMHKIFDAALDAGACGVALNGAGSGIFAFVVNNAQSVARAMSKAGSASGLSGYSLQLRIQHEGAKVMRV